MFAANPEKYAPQYGGYCAKGIADNRLVTIDPKAWTIVDDKLYLNYSRSVKKPGMQVVINTLQSVIKTGKPSCRASLALSTDPCALMTTY